MKKSKKRIFLTLGIALVMAVGALIAFATSSDDGDVYYDIFKDGVKVYSSESADIGAGISNTVLGGISAPSEKEEYLILCYRNVEISSNATLNNFPSPAESPASTYDLVIDLQGNKLSSKTHTVLGSQSGNSYYDATLTFKNGTYDAAASAQHMKVRKGYTVIFDNVSFVASDARNNLFYDDGLKAVIFKDSVVNRMWKQMFYRKHAYDVHGQIVFDNTEVVLGNAIEPIFYEVTTGTGTLDVIFTGNSRISSTAGNYYFTMTGDKLEDADKELITRIILERGTMLSGTAFPSGGYEYGVYESVRLGDEGFYTEQGLIETPIIGSTLNTKYPNAIGSALCSLTVRYTDGEGVSKTESLEGLCDGLYFERTLSDKKAYFNSEDEGRVWLEKFEGWASTEGGTALPSPITLEGGENALYSVFSNVPCSYAELSPSADKVIAGYLEESITAEALNRVYEGNLLRLYRDMDVSDTAQTLTGGYTVDLNGYTLYKNATTEPFKLAGRLGIMGGTLDISESCGFVIMSGGRLELTDTVINYDTIAPLRGEGGSVKLAECEIKTHSPTASPDFIRVSADACELTVLNSRVDISGDLIALAQSEAVKLNISLTVNDTEFTRLGGYAVSIETDAQSFKEFSKIVVTTLRSDTFGRLVSDDLSSTNVETRIQDFSGDNAPKPGVDDSPVVGVN